METLYNSLIALGQSDLRRMVRRDVNGTYRTDWSALRDQTVRIIRMGQNIS